MRERIPLVAHNAGVPAFPGAPAPSEDDGAHVTGVAAHALLAGHPLARWGPEWLAGGVMSMRYRRGLHVGDPLTLEIEHREDRMTLDLLDETGALVADAEAWCDDSVPLHEPSDLVGGPLPDPKLDPEPAALQGSSIGALEFAPDAARDLAFLEALPPDDPWRSAASVHPAWVASGVNDLLRRSIAFEGERWIHAGTKVQSHRPIRPGSPVRLVAEVDQVFERRGRHFADVAVAAVVERAQAMSLVLTIVYA